MTKLRRPLNLQGDQRDYAYTVAPMQQLASKHEDIKAGRKVTRRVIDTESNLNRTGLEPKFNEQILTKDCADAIP